MDKRWLDKGIYVFSREDILLLHKENMKTRKNIYTMLSVSAPLLILLVLLVCFLSNYLMEPKVGDIGAIGPSGETVQLIPSINPSPTKEMAFKFASSAALEIRTFFFSTYFKDIRKVEHLFTPEAYNEYLLELYESGLFSRVKNESLNVTSALSPKSSINAAFTVIDGERLFFIKIDLILRVENLSGDDEFSKESLFFTLVETDRGVSKHGLQIKSLEPF